MDEASLGCFVAHQMPREELEGDSSAERQVRCRRPAAALDLLDRAVRTGRGLRTWIEHDPDLDSLRSLPRYQEILARLPP